ncbi:hypothetical protein [Paenibacillus xylanexedens]|uniref:Butirosin biosynthesis protein H N-terminal domain-containing protein n=1 Tax=Paenibacillus xylanexedens TaxID=528191 RepID=A0ABS4RSH0_PAEXY|nr:hypothetical protein [Paenibacillus xylanexedens]MBP2245832.1 hypothetical protein [Paenibacillus xylanexedens]
MKIILPINRNIPYGGMLRDMNRIVAITSNSLALPWYINNFIPQLMYDTFNIHCYDAENTYEIFNIYDEVAEFKLLEIGDDLQSIIESLKKEEYVLVNWDRYYVKQSNDYLKKHQYQEALIYGFDSGKNSFNYHESLINNKDYDTSEIAYDDLYLALRQSLEKTQQMEARNWQFAFSHPFSSFSIKKQFPKLNLRKMYHNFYTQLQGAEIEFSYGGNVKKKYYSGMMIFKGLQTLLNDLENNESLERYNQAIWSIKIFSQHMKSHEVRFKYVMEQNYIFFEQDIFDQIELVSRKLMIFFSLLRKYAVTLSKIDLSRARELLIEIKELYLLFLKRANILIENAIVNTKNNYGDE